MNYILFLGSLDVCDIIVRQFSLFVCCMAHTHTAPDSFIENLQTCSYFLLFFFVAVFVGFFFLFTLTLSIVVFFLFLFSNHFIVDGKINKRKIALHLMHQKMVLAMRFKMNIMPNWTNHHFPRVFHCNKKSYYDFFHQVIPIELWGVCLKQLILKLVTILLFSLALREFRLSK